jgi:hypothetical protein
MKEKNQFRCNLALVYVYLLLSATIAATAATMATIPAISEH